MTTQTPDAVREADPRVEIVAKALGLHRYPGGTGPINPPTRWPLDPTDKLDGRDGKVPLTWDFAEKCRADARVMLAALDSRAGDAAEGLADAQLKDAVSELLSHRGERPYRILRGGQALWETWVPSFRAAIRYLPATPAPAVDAKARADMAAALRNTPAEALREAGYLERAAQMIEAPAVDAVPAGEVELQPMSLAPKDGSYILARYNNDYALDRDRHYNGRWFVIRHPGASPGEYDLGWNLFPGYGGVPDFAFDGWLPLPTISALSHGEGRK
ncbi:hypothetical protein RN629_01210 [Sphingomonadaceae bacterium jetA1]|jgi:hypothetical protein|uniref:hypothetical protein n=1 Tax=Facivitalis istanbulensis TaxID=3075838 RepID=UPI00349984BB